ncbi:hypothetical protein [uncultured Roseobacter sp.]|uniref:hypothetical protein n=1 Tax=uncultured Roseobacter sp. TaxID=114847 RepID=UPI00262AAE6C|nr:hypothetical protein [uncultured Roseobacter sp.]
MNKCKLTDKVIGSRKITIYDAFENALDARRVGKKTDTAKWLKAALTEIDGLDIFDDKQMAAFTKAAQAFLKKNGYFGYGAAFKKRAGDLKKLTSIFKKSGGTAAQRASQSLHASMERSGEIPRGMSFADFESELTSSFKDIPKFSNANDKAVNAVKWPGIIRNFALPKGSEKDLKLLGGSIIKHGASNKKTIDMAKEILAAAKNTRKKGIELVLAVDDKLVDEMM